MTEFDTIVALYLHDLLSHPVRCEGDEGRAGELKAALTVLGHADLFDEWAAARYKYRILRDQVTREQVALTGGNAYASLFIAPRATESWDEMNNACAAQNAVNARIKELGKRFSA